MVDYSIFEIFDKSKMSWDRWITRFEGSYQIISPREDKKQSLMLHYIGMETYDLLCDKVAPVKPEDRTYEQLKAILKAIFDPTPLEIVENYRFHLRKQADDETVEEFSIALRKLAIHCKFDHYLDTALRNQFIFGLRSSRIQNRLLETDKLTVETALNTAKSMELSAKGGAEIQQQKETKQSVSYIHQKSSKKSNGKNMKSNAKSGGADNQKKNEFCFRCGKKDHRANKCSHINSTCSFCKRKGHLQGVCFKAKAEKKQTNYIDEDETESVDEIFHIQSKEIYQNNRSKICIDLNVNDVVLGFEIDSGSPVTIISNNDKERYFPLEIMRPSDTKLVSYCGTEITVLGYFGVCVNSGIESGHLKLYVVESNRRPLLGREWLRKLKLDWNRIFNTKQNAKVVSSIKQQIHTTRISERIDQLKRKYSSVFEKSMGRIEGIQARIRLQPNAEPIFVKARKLPFALRDAVEKELDELERNGIIQKVDSARWATPIVPVKKQGNKVRLCGDYKITVNPRIVVEEYPLPTIEELFASMAGGEKFTKIDLTKAYLQLEVHEDDREILTLSTHRGLYKPTRLMYGIASGPAKWQREIEQILKDIEGVSVFLDDIKITAPNDEIHLQRLEMVLSRLSKYNMRVNFDKCEFMEKEIVYCGYKIDRMGIHKVQNKIDAITKMPEPTNKEEIRAFIGLINYYGRFFENLSTIVYPMNNLLKEHVEFNWNAECKKAFNTVKKQIQDETHLAHYDPKLPLVLATDASPVGVGAVLSHIYPDGSEKPIQFASQTLSPVQQRYTQIDREAYGIIFGIRKFYQYVYARKFILITDNKPLSQILSPEKGLPTLSATRMQHYAIFLQSFTYEIRYRKSADHSNADALSRLPLTEINRRKEEIEVIELNAIETLPVSVKQLREATLKDGTVQELIDGLRSGIALPPEKRFNIEQTEFTLQNDCLLRGLRVYVPKELRQQVLNELHTAHFGITRMKALARSYCWWPRLDAEIEQISRNCLQCQLTRPNPKKVTTHVWEAAKRPFERVHVDFAGPFMGNYYFILIDAYTKWPEVYVIPNITTKTTMDKCREIFSRFGIPEVLVSDNGPQFTSDEFRKFMEMNGIIHKRSAPYHPATNGQVERNVQTFKNKLKTINCNRSELGKVLQNILPNYRRTPHATTGESPAMKMFNRQIRSRLDVMMPKEKNEENTPNGEINVRQLKINDRVTVRDYLSGEKYQFGSVIEVLGKLHYMIKLDDGRVWKRHINQIHRIGSEIPIPEKDIIPYNYDLSENRNLIPANTEVPENTNVEIPQHRTNIEDDAQPGISTQIVTENASNSEHGRPIRVRNVTKRLMYDREFKQVTN